MKKTLILLLTFLFLSCHYTEKFENREEDKVAAEKITSQVFAFVKKSDYDSAMNLFDKKFFEATPKAEMKNIFEVTETKLGKLKSTKLEQCTTVTSEGAIETGTYVLVYDCDFEKEKGKLNITLTKSEDHKIRVIGYRIESKAFLE